MRPLTLTIEGLRSFRSQATIDFADRTHIAIIGDTGAGKSSILEALTFALYGHSTWSKQANQYLVADGAPQLRVELTFRVSGQTWRVQRSIRRTAKGDPGPAQAKLERLSDDGEPIERIDNVRTVNARTVEVLGLEWEAFIRTVVLPQGEFARLLVADKPTERSAILRQVWRTDELLDAAAQADAAVAALAEPAGRLTEARRAYPDDPAVELEGRRREAAAAAERLRAEQQRLDAVKAAADQLAAAGATLETLAAAEADVSAIDVAAARSSATALADVAAALDSQQERTTADAERLRASRDAVPDDTHDGPGMDATAAAETRLRDMTTVLERLTKAHGVLQELRDDVAAAGAAAAGAEQAARDAEGSLATHLEGRDRLDKAHHAAQDLQRRAADVLAQARRADATVARDRELVEAALALLERAEATLTAANAARGAADDAYAEAENRWRTAHREHAAASAAHGLHAGDECPVCARELPDGWSPPAAATLDQVDRARADAATARDQAQSDLAAATARRDGAKEALDDARRRLSASEGEAAASVRQLAEILEADERRLDLDADDDGLLGSLQAALTEAATALKAFDEQTETLRARQQATALEARGAREKAAAADQRLTASRAAADQLLDDLRGWLDQLPPPFRPKLEVPDDIEAATVDASAVDLARAAVAERRDVLMRRATERKRLQADVDAALATLRNVEQRRARDVTAPFRALCRQLDDSREVLAAVRQRLGLTGTLPGRAADSDLREVAVVVDALFELQSTTLTAIRQRADGARKDETAASEALRRHSGGRAGDPGALVAGATEACNTALVAARRAEDAVQSLEQSLGRIRRIDELSATVVELRGALTDLSAALKPGAFPKWLTLRRSRALLAVASTLLSDMTRGRYGFAEIDDEDAEWLIYDNDSGQARAPSTLSGGEKFVASLSLALAMVELMARSGGRLESLFLDEGFGALDRANLDAAVEALAAVAARGRMVAVISHVRAVAEQVDDVLTVTREPTGTKVAWLTSAERRQLVTADALTSADAAMAGLLD